MGLLRYTGLFTERQSNPAQPWYKRRNAYIQEAWSWRKEGAERFWRRPLGQRFLLVRNDGARSYWNIQRRLRGVERGVIKSIVWVVSWVTPIAITSPMDSLTLSRPKVKSLLCMGLI